MRCIDADELIETIDCSADLGGTLGKVVECVKLYAKHMIASAPTVNAWIPCSERLPQENGRYLVTRGLNACGSLWNRVYIVNYSDLMGLLSERIWWQGNVGKSDFERLKDVIAWQPLPEPWKGEKNGQI